MQSKAKLTPMQAMLALAMLGGLEAMPQRKPWCDRCRGTGDIGSDKCPDCGGTGDKARFRRDNGKDSNS